jgi:CubicO group peptidase (beta-lactamase class C family)
MNKIFFRDDSVYLRFAEFFTEFGGKYDRNKNTITGTWVTEDKVRMPVTFVQVNGDTVLGMNPRSTKVYNYSSPINREDQWPVSTIERQSIDRTQIDSLTYAIMNEKYPDVHSLLIARNDSLIYEEYFYTFNSQSRQNIQSVTKSFVSALTGIALAKGEIKNINDPLCGYLTKYKKLACNDQNKTITLHQVLSMSTGLEWDEATYDYGDPRNSNSYKGNPFKYLFAKKRSVQPVFAYNSLNHLTMNAVLKTATHMDNATEITSRLLAPLGINSYHLGKEEHGVLGDIELTPRDMMKLGQLYLRNGKWNGMEVVPHSWVNESTSTKIATTRPGLGYGYFWWTRDFNWKGKTVRSFFAWGYGGQYIFVVPDLQLVVTLTGSHWTTDPKNHVMEMMENYIIPSCN